MSFEAAMPRLTAILLIGLLAPHADPAGAEERELEAGAVPQRVLEAFRASHADAEYVEWWEKSTDGVNTFQAEFRENAIEKEAAFESSGKLVFLEQEIPVSRVPEPVTRTLKARYPDAVIEETQEVLRPDGSLHAFSIEIRAGGRDKDLYIDAAGKWLSEDGDG